MTVAETLPAYQYFMYPLLSVLARHPEGLRRSDAADEVADFMALSEAQRAARHNSGARIPENRIDWAKTRLINLGYVHVEQRGLWEITDAGRTLLQAHPSGFDEATVQDLHERSAALQSPALSEGPAYDWLLHVDRDSADLETFVTEGVWRPTGFLKDGGFEKIQVGDRAALKNVTTVSRDAPFELRGYRTGAMDIYATGIVAAVDAEQQTLSVNWVAWDAPRRWYFSTNTLPIWGIPRHGGKWYHGQLIDFIFDGAAQDIDRFRNDPYWRDRFGDDSTPAKQFPWIPFYMEFADKLLAYREPPRQLGAMIESLHHAGIGRLGLTQLLDELDNGVKLPLIDPFTFFATFNRGTKDEHRLTILNALADIVGIDPIEGMTFDGIPTVHNQLSWFMTGDDGDVLYFWRMFAGALRYAEEPTKDARATFIKDYDVTSNLPNVGWKLTQCFFWMRPYQYVPLDAKSRDYIQNVLEYSIPTNSLLKRITGTDYLNLCDTLLAYFERDDALVHSFVELSAAAYDYSSFDDGDLDDEDFAPSEAEVGEQAEAYTLDDILADGCFLDKEALETIFRRLESKKNIILQGPPGTGKTWLGRRLAYALIGSKNKEKLHAVQFHPNLSYEDFVRGYRPSSDGQLEVIDGPLMRAVEAARKAPHAKHVVLIEEFNRGNPAQIFGEMLTLIENTQRAPEHALQLTYSHSEDVPVYVPPNLYLIGTMNIADRSLALVDFALRRRFAFIDMYPMFNDKWKHWVQEHAGVSAEFARRVQHQMTQLNAALTDSVGLGKQFQVGHSYVTPHNNQQIADANAWFRDVIETEIGPLLHEYWFDNPAQAEKETARLLTGVG